MNFKRRRPKNARAGCLVCKPHKANGCHGQNPRRADLRASAADGRDGAGELRPLRAENPPAVAERRVWAAIAQNAAERARDE